MATAAQSPTAIPGAAHGGDAQDLPPPAPLPKKSKAKKEKQLSAEENAKLVQARLSQLEQEKAGEKNQQAEVDREVKKATRDLNELMNSVEGPMNRLDVVQRKYEELLAEMKKLERDHTKSKKRGDQLQKDSDKAKTEHTKTASMKEKLEKLCRELTKENKKLKDENKKLEETEKQAREDINDRMDQMLYDVQEVMNSKTAAHSENLHLELDELYVSRRLSFSLATHVLTSAAGSKPDVKSSPIRPIFVKPTSKPSYDTRMPRSPIFKPNTRSKDAVQTQRPLDVGP